MEIRFRLYTHCTYAHDTTLTLPPPREITKNQPASLEGAITRILRRRAHKNNTRFALESGKKERETTKWCKRPVEHRKVNIAGVFGLDLLGIVPRKMSLYGNGNLHLGSNAVFYICVNLFDWRLYYESVTYE